MSKNKIILLILFVIPFLLIFHSFFVISPLAWGDAPYFYPEKLHELFNLPFLWDYRTNNFGAPQGQVIWLYIPVTLIAVTYRFLHINPEYLNQIFFYFPATLGSFVGMYLLLSLFVKNVKAVFLGSFLYLFNTYLLSLIDGGQLGVSLAYGFFPLAIYSLVKMLKVININNFFLALIFLLVLSNTDLRVFILVPITFVVIIFCFRKNFKISFKKNLLFLGLLFLSILSLDLFWVLPLISFYGQTSASLPSIGGSLINLLHPLLLYHPNFPLNEFGKIIYPKFYFVIFPSILLVSVFTASKLKLKRYTFVSLVSFFLLFVFLAKGDGDPGGVIYSTIISHLPFGVSFRDATKFYIPLLVIMSFLIALNTEYFMNKYSKSRSYIFFLSYLLLVLMISPAFMGQMTGVLGKSEFGDYQKIATHISKDHNFSRTLWFPEVPPFAFNSWQKPDLSANYFYQERPLASLIVGNYDLYNFLHSAHIKDWFRLLGIRYIVIDQNHRKKTWSEKELGERAQFLGFIDNIFGQSSKNWSSYLPVYEIKEPLPHFFLQKKAFLIVGSEDIYKYLFLNPQYKLENIGMIFSENKDLDLNYLKNLKPESLAIIFNDTSRIDLTMSLLKKYIVGGKEAKSSQFAYFPSDRYLDWKYELLQNGVTTEDLDFGKGVAFSTQKGEKIQFDLDTKPQKYFLAFRYTNSSSSSGLKLNYIDQTEILYNSKVDHFVWKIIGPMDIKNAKTRITLTNTGGFAVINGLAIIPENTFNEAKRETDKLLSRYQTLNIDPNLDSNNLGEVINNSYKRVNFTEENPTEYVIDEAKGYNWLVFTDHYHQSWEVDSHKSLPFYNMINGFYIGGNKDTKMKLQFKEQSLIYLGIKLSIASLLVIFATTIMIIVYSKRKHVQKP